MTESIDLTAAQRNMLLLLLRRYLPGVAIWAYGSRVKWTARPNSDLDLVVFTTPAQRRQVGDLKDALAESNLPFPVDLHVWDDVPERFREIILKEYVVVQEARELGGKRGGTGEWREVDVEEIKAPTENALATGPFGSSIGSRFFTTSGIPVIRGSNLSEDIGTRLNDQGLVFLAPEKAGEFSRSKVRDGDLIFTCWGTVNQIGLIDRRAAHREYIISNKQMKLTPDPAKADSLFLYYLFSSPELQARIKNQSIGSSVPGFNLGQLRAMRIQLPELGEQRAIAHILGTLDDKIELNRRMNETLEAMARALFKSWFVDFEPVRAKMEGRDPGLPKPLADLFPSCLVDSELGEIPAGWKLASLPDAVAVNPARSLPVDVNAPYLDMANMPTRGHTPNAVVDRPFGSGMRFMNGDTLVARITPCLENGKTAFVDFLADGQVGWGSTEYIVLRPKPPLPDEFAYCLARSDEFRDFAIQSMTGTSGRQRVPPEVLSHYSLVMPPESVAALFGRMVRPLFAEASHAARESRTLAALRDALLPKLVSGELRVTDAERLMERGCEPTARNHDPYRVRW